MQVLLLLQVYQEEFGTVRGHFGPVNAVAFHPDGRRYALHPCQHLHLCVYACIPTSKPLFGFLSLCTCIPIFLCSCLQ